MFFDDNLCEINMKGYAGKGLAFRKDFISSLVLGLECFLRQSLMSVEMLL